MYKIIALIGEAGSGKDTIMQGILKRCPTQFHEIISCTTRPIREGEKDGVNYHFFTPDNFTNKVKNNEMLEYTMFNNWFYGTSYDSLQSDTINIGVFNPAGIWSLRKFDNIDLIVYKIVCSDKTRMLRQLNREEHPNVDEIVRRYKTDKEDFSNLNFYYTEIENEDEEKGITTQTKSLSIDNTLKPKIALMLLISLQLMYYFLFSLLVFLYEPIFKFQLNNYWILILSLVVSLSLLFAFNIKNIDEKNNFAKNSLIILFTLSTGYYLSFLFNLIHSMTINVILLSLSLYNLFLFLLFKLSKGKTNKVVYIIYNIIIGIIFLFVLIKTYPEAILSNIAVIFFIALLSLYTYRLMLSRRVKEGPLLKNMIKYYIYRL